MCTVQVVDEIYNKAAATKMGIEEKGQVVLMIHCGSRGFGHQVCPFVTDCFARL